jgi:hypothetical protein
VYQPISSSSAVTADPSRLVAESYDALAGDRAFTAAVEDAGVALAGMSEDAARDVVVAAMRRLSGSVAAVPDPWA